MNVTNCHSNPQSCDKVDYEVYEEGDGSSGLHTIYTVQVLKIRSALYPRDVGEFKCVASNGVSPDAELIVSLDVQGTLYKQRNTFVLYVTICIIHVQFFLPHLQLMICSKPTSRALVPLYSCSNCDP